MFILPDIQFPLCSIGRLYIGPYHEYNSRSLLSAPHHNFSIYQLLFLAAFRRGQNLPKESLVATVSFSWPNIEMK